MVVWMNYDVSFSSRTRLSLYFFHLLREDGKLFWFLNTNNNQLVCWRASGQLSSSVARQKKKIVRRLLSSPPPPPTPALGSVGFLSCQRRQKERNTRSICINQKKKTNREEYEGCHAVPKVGFFGQQAAGACTWFAVLRWNILAFFLGHKSRFLRTTHMHKQIYNVLVYTIIREYSIYTAAENKTKSANVGNKCPPLIHK